MQKTVAILAALGALSLGTTSALAQAELIGADALDDRLEDIEEEAAEEFEEAEDRARFGFEAYPQGWSGSVSAAGSLSDFGVEEENIDIGGRLRYGLGANNFALGFAAEYDDRNDTESTTDIFLTGDYNRFLTDQFYLFALGRYERDDQGDIGESEDAFVGVGPGVRLYNTPNFAWRVQAGPGVRWTEDLADDSETEAALVAASFLFYEFNESTFFTNDTEMLYSDEAGTRVINDAGVNFRVTNALSTRVSYRTDWWDERAEETENELRFSLVYGFN